jgi:hypothetical protein
LEINHHTKPINSSGTNSTHNNSATVTSSNSTNTTNELVNTIFADIDDTNDTATTPTIFNNTDENGPIGSATNGTVLLASTNTDRNGSERNNKINSTRAIHHHIKPRTNSTTAATTHNSDAIVTSSNSTNTLNTTNDLANTTFASIAMGNDTALLDHFKKANTSKKRKEKRREKSNDAKENNVEIVEEKHASAHDQKYFLRGKSSRMDKTTTVQ